MLARVRHDLYSESHIGMVVTDREFLDGHSRAAGVDGSLRVGRTHEVNFLTMRTGNRDLEGVERSGHIVEANVRSRAGTWATFSVITRSIPIFRLIPASSGGSI